MKKHRETNMRS